MTKQEFLETKEPLVLIASLNLETGKILYDTYPYDSADGFMDDYKKDFPDMVHFYYANPASIKLRKQRYGLTESDEEN